MKEGRFKCLMILMVFFVTCTYVQSQTVINFKITQAPQLMVNAGMDTFIYLGDTIELGGNPTASSGTPPYDYSWTPVTNLNDASISNPLANPTASTTYSLTVSDAKNCSYSDDIYVKVSLTDIGEMAGHIRFSVYPNPTDGKFNLQLTGLKKNDQLELVLINPVGQIIESRTIEGYRGKYEEVISLSREGKGVYIVRITGENTFLLRQIIVY